MGKLTGRVALITGGARGIGRAYATTLAKLGADVGVVDLDLSPWEYSGGEVEQSVLEELRGLGVRAAGAEADVRDHSGLRSAIDSVRGELGDVTILVANAGGGGRGARYGKRQWGSDLDFDEFRHKIEANLFGTAYAVNAVAADMKRARWGKIVTVASVSALMPRADGSHADYAAAKAAVVTYTRCLAAELGPFGITANCIAPGLITTDRIKEAYADVENPAEHVALRRLGTPEDCATVVGFLSTDDSAYVNGAVIETHGQTLLNWWGKPLEPWWEPTEESRVEG